MTAAHPAASAANATQTVRWFIWDISSPTADLLFAVSNFILVVAALGVFIGTIGSVTLTGVREVFSNDRIGANERATDEARSAAAKANEGVARASAKIKTAEAKTAEANARAAEANLETEKIRTTLAWREISPAQAKAAENILSGHLSDVVLWHLSSDPEATNLYLQMKQIFDAAKVANVDDRQLINSGTPRFGVILAGRKEHVELMERALAAAGVEVTSIAIHDQPLNVWIGTKPRRR